MSRFNPFDIYQGTKKIKDQELKDYSRNSNAGDFFPDSRFSNTALKTSVDYKKIKLFLIIIFLGLAIILFRIFWLELVTGSSLRDIAEGNRIRIETIKAPRGIINDNSNNLLVRNVPNFVLYLTPADLPEEEIIQQEIFGSIADILGIAKEEIEQSVKKAKPYSYEPIEIKDQIEYTKALLLYIKTKSLPGVNLKLNYSREYLDSKWTAHLIGYTGKITEEELNQKDNQGYLLTDYVGKTGIEKKYENELKGLDGKKRVEVDSLGKEKKLVASQNPQSGKNLTLTINLGLQKVLTENLQAQVKQTNSPGGAAVAIDPRNGEVLALVSVPGFDSNQFTKGLTSDELQNIINDPNRPLFNRAIAGQYPSGSTIKPIIASAALQEGIITPNTTILSTGGIKAGPNFFPDWKAGGHGLTDVRRALAESINTFFYTVGGGTDTFAGLGVERIDKYAKLFGLGEKLGIDLPGEATGFLPSSEWKKQTKNDRWYLGDTYHLSIGQGDLLVTPLQVASYIATIANGGTVYQPQLVKSIYDPNTKLTKTIDSTNLRAGFISSAYLKVVREGLRQAVTSGSARALQTLAVSTAGKTGTAQTGEGNKTHAWFTGFAPYDTPELVITVIVEEGGEGNIAALPVARAGWQWYFNQK